MKRLKVSLSPEVALVLDKLRGGASRTEYLEHEILAKGRMRKVRPATREELERIVPEAREPTSEPSRYILRRVRSVQRQGGEVTDMVLSEIAQRARERFGGTYPKLKTPKGALARAKRVYKKYGDTNHKTTKVDNSLHFRRMSV